jgi:hypothetical protein
MFRTSTAALLLFLGTAPVAAQHSPANNGQAIVDFLLEYLAVRYPGTSFEDDLLYVSISRQSLFHVKRGRSLDVYRVSTALRGIGNAVNSHRTPTGLHRVAVKYGEGVPQLGILRNRIYTGEQADPGDTGQDSDLITSRILWLEGLEKDVNSGGRVDSKARHIYIHGTANERAIGTACSRGCVRMLNSDVIRLFDAVSTGTPVVILDN